MPFRSSPVPMPPIDSFLSPIANGIQQLFQGQPNPSEYTWGDYVSQGVNPAKWNEAQTRVMSSQLSDTASKIYELRNQGNYPEANKLQFQLVSQAGQLAKVGGSDIANMQMKQINNMLNSSSEDAMAYMAHQVNLANVGIDSQVMTPEQMNDPEMKKRFPNQYRNGMGNVGFGYNPQAAATDPKLLEKYMRELSIPEDTTPPEESASFYGKTPEDLKNIYKGFYRTIAYARALQQSAKSGEREAGLSKEINAWDNLRKIQMLGQQNGENTPISTPEEANPTLAKYGMSWMTKKPTDSINSKGLSTHSVTWDRKTDPQMHDEIINYLQNNELPPEEQDKLGKIGQDKTIIDAIRRTAEGAIENSHLMGELKKTLSQDANGKTIPWTNPETGETEQMPAFTAGQGMRGLEEYIKNNWNPFGVWQKLGASPTDPLTSKVNKLAGLVAENYMRANSGQQTAEAEANRLKGLLVDGVSSGDPSKFWSGIRQSEEIIKRSMISANRAIESSGGYISPSYREEFRKGIPNYKDPYKTKWALPPKTNSTSSPFSEPSKMAPEDMQLLKQYYENVEPFKSMPDKTKEEQRIKIQAVKKFFIELKSQPPRAQ